MNEWTVKDVNGIEHKIGCKLKAGGPQVFVDGNTYKAKSSNWFVNVIDYAVDLPGTNCHVVMIGKKARLAVNGIYLDNGERYEPVSSVPAWVWVLVALSVIGGWFFGGILCLAIGAALSTIYITGALQKNNKKVILAFVAFIVIALILFGLQVVLLGATS